MHNIPPIHLIVAFDAVAMRLSFHLANGVHGESAVVEAARHQDLRFRDGRGLVRVVVLERQRGAGEHFRFPGIQRDGLHGFARFLRMLEATQHLISAFDDMPGHVAFVGYAHIAHGVAADKAIAANEAEHAPQQLIAARAVVRVQQDDFVGFAGVDLVGMAQAQHVFCVLAPALVTHAGLAHHEGLKPLLAKLGQHGSGRDVAVPLGTAFMRGIREDGRGHPTNLVIGQRGFAAQCGGVVSEAGSELHDLSPNEVGC